MSYALSCCAAMPKRLQVTSAAAGISCFRSNVQAYKPTACQARDQNTVSTVTTAHIAYLIVTIICEYKILRFLDSDDFAGINFCDFTKSS